MCGEDIHILLVEDEDAHSELIRRAFASRPGRFRLAVAQNLREASSCLAESTPDLVIADLILPDGKGTELLPGDRDGLPYPVVVMTGQGDQQAAVEAMKSGALDYVVKSEATLANMPYFAERALRQWEHIVERKKAEKALAEERNLLRTLIDNLPDTIHIKDTEGRIITCNVALAHLAGAETPGQMRGKTNFDFYPQKLAEEYYAEEQQVIRTGQPLISREKQTINDVNGSPRWLLTTKVPLRDGSGNIIGLVGISRDITERKRAEKALAEERNLLRTLIDTIPDYIYIKDTESRLITCNVALAHLVGAETPEQTRGKNAFDFCQQDRELLEEFYAEEQQVIRTGRPLISREKRTRDNAEGNAVWYSTTKVPLRDSSGNIIGLVGISRDVTARKLAEQALAKERNLLRTLIDIVPDYIYVKDAESRLITCNTALAHFWGVAVPDELVGKTDFDFYPRKLKLAEEYYADEQRVIQTGQPLINREKQTEDDAEGNPRWLLTTKVPLQDSYGKIIGLVGIGRDITERKKSQDAVARSEAIYRRSIENARGVPYQMRLSDGKYLFMGSGIEEMVGIEAEKLTRDVFNGLIEEAIIGPGVGCKLLTAYYDAIAHGRIEQDRRHMKAYYEAVSRGEVNHYQADIHIRTPAGDTRWLSDCSLPVRDEKTGEAVSFIGILQDITDRKLAEQEILASREKLRRLASEQCMTEERERRRLAAGIHDCIGQNLVLAKLELQSLAKSVSSCGGGPARASLKNICGMIDRVISDAHSLTFEMSSPVLHELGFAAAVKAYLAEQVEDKHGIRYKFTAGGRGLQLEDEVRTVLFQAVRELLVNVVRHAKASRVDVRIERVSERIRVAVEDDGVGFVVSEGQLGAGGKKGGFGLFGIEQRLGYLGGGMEVKSAPGQGTSVILTVQLKGGRVGLGCKGVSG